MNKNNGIEYKDFDLRDNVALALRKICSDEDEYYKVIDVLHNPNAHHADRVWLVGFLQYTECNFRSILTIIHTLNWWSDYQQAITYQQAFSVFTEIKDNILPDTPRGEVERSPPEENPTL